MDTPPLLQCELSLPAQRRDPQGEPGILQDHPDIGKRYPAFRSASSTASGRRAITASSTLAGPSGLVRPCSQFLRVAGWKPNLAANCDWLSRSLFLKPARTPPQNRAESPKTIPKTVRKTVETSNKGPNFRMVGAYATPFLFDRSEEHT